ncbi:MAG: hypothetical protein NVS4B9_09090 [Ktedonobacteraceae bacterium]
MNVQLQTQTKTALQSSFTPVQTGLLQRKCACGQHTVAGTECEECRQKHESMVQHAAVRAVPASGMASIMHEAVNESGQSLDFGTQAFMESRFSHDFTGVQVQNNAIVVQPQGVDIADRDDPIHAPLLEQYRHSTGQPPHGVDEFGQRVGPSDAELKYGGLLTAFGNLGRATWLPPVINRRNFAEVIFHSPLINGTAGLTTPFINEKELHDSNDVLSAIPRPAIEHRTDRGQNECWFTHGVNVTGHTTMDILTPGPWNLTMPKSEAATHYSWERSCQTGGGTTTIHVDARPNAAAMERYVRLGEAEHDTDIHQAFNNNIAVYVANVNGLLSDTPGARAVGTNPVTCEARLRQLENRDLLINFAIDMNAATGRRHQNYRHSVAHTGLSINHDCSRITERVEAGTL